MYELWKDLVPRKNTLKEKTNGDFLIVSSFNLEIFYLNDTAREFFSWINGHRSIDQIVDQLMEVYDVDRYILQDDMIDVIRELQWKNLVSLRRRSYEGICSP